MVVVLVGIKVEWVAVVVPVVRATVGVVVIFVVEVVVVAGLSCEGVVKMGVDILVILDSLVVSDVEFAVMEVQFEGNVALTGRTQS